MEYQNKRGGRILLQDIAKPAQLVHSGVEAMEAALNLEKRVNQALFDLHTIAEKHGDSHLQDILEGEFLNEQVESIKELSDMIANLKRAGPGLGEYLFDKHTLKGE